MQHSYVLRSPLIGSLVLGSPVLWSLVLGSLGPWVPGPVFIVFHVFNEIVAKGTFLTKICPPTLDVVIIKREASKKQYCVRTNK